MFSSLAPRCCRCTRRTHAVKRCAISSVLAARRGFECTSKYHESYKAARSYPPTISDKKQTASHDASHAPVAPRRRNRKQEHDHIGNVWAHGPDQEGPHRHRWKDRVVCKYSGRMFVPVAFPGLPVHVEARMVKMGHGEIKIDGEVLTFDGVTERLTHTSRYLAPNQRPSA